MVATHGYVEFDGPDGLLKMTKKSPRLSKSGCSALDRVSWSFKEKQIMSSSNFELVESFAYLQP